MEKDLKDVQKNNVGKTKSIFLKMCQWETALGKGTTELL